MDVTFGQVLAGVGTILGIAVVQFARDWRDGKSLFQKNGSAESNTTLRSILETLQSVNTRQGTLNHHFNDETTALLTEIKELLQLAQAGQEKEYAQHREILSKQDEMLKYGLPIRR